MRDRRTLLRLKKTHIYYHVLLNDVSTDCSDHSTLINFSLSTSAHWSRAENRCDRAPCFLLPYRNKSRNEKKFIAIYEGCSSLRSNEFERILLLVSCCIDICEVSYIPSLNLIWSTFEGNPSHIPICSTKSVSTYVKM